MVLDNLSFDFTFQLSALCLVILTVATYLIKGLVLCRAIHTAWDKEGANDESMLGWASWCMIVCTVMAISWVVAQIVPFFADLVQVIGSSLSPINCFIVPILMYVRWLQDFGGKRDQIGALEWSIIAVELIFAVVLMVAGTYYSARTLATNWEFYGPPFACHCEGMWNTCGCSGTHAGMEVCLMKNDIVATTFMPSVVKGSLPGR
eukprot:TRINITY_DN36287_c0_g1_i2.p3 TRINITY_DN36287_c0_g1~~TRINITY_DN36287_c0_g1_i2.p3  ORF type:complete len:205 (+),score=46.18 TRINITY_DN36287_c0_g1_i2:1029-1643(+)